MNLKAVIVEDSRLARVELKTMLAAFDHIEVVGEAEDGFQAIELIQDLQPDLIFLDIQLPGKNGFEVLEAIDEVPQVIFTTAFDEYAIKAFEFNALDYLLKPIQPKRLDQAIEKLSIPKGSDGASLLDEDSRVFVKDGENCWFVALKEVRLFESYGNYSRIYFDTHQPLIHKSLNYLESVLDPDVFFRINRQQILNLKYIQGVAAWFNGRLKLRLKSGEEVEVSRRQTNRIKDLFSL